jgi:hypothetical protein
MAHEYSCNYKYNYYYNEVSLSFVSGNTETVPLVYICLLVVFLCVFLYLLCNTPPLHGCRTRHCAFAMPLFVTQILSSHCLYNYSLFLYWSVSASYPGLELQIYYLSITVFTLHHAVTLSLIVVFYFVSSYTLTERSTHSFPGFILCFH